MQILKKLVQIFCAMAGLNCFYKYTTIKFIFTSLMLTVMVVKREYCLLGTDHIVNSINKHSYAIYLIHLLVIEVLSISEIIHGKLFALAVVIFTAIVSWTLDSIIHDIGYLLKNKKGKI